jgi:predicted NAD-dependent protein-ADP-ribosyltransferase YbiA (DUF1768 family)
MAKSEYRVISPLKLDGKRYQVGDTVRIEDERTEVIEPLVKARIIEAATPGEAASAEAAKAVIARILAAQTTEEVVELSHADTRKTVADAARKRLTELGAQE